VSQSIHKKKIFWVAHEGNRSGANNALLDYAQMLNDGNYDVTVIVPSAGSMKDEGVKRRLKIKLFYYYPAVYLRKSVDIFFWLRKRLRNIVTLFQFGFFIIKSRPDVIITNSIVTTPLFAVTANIFRIKHIWFIQEFGNIDHGLKFDFGYSLTVRIINYLSKRVVVVSDAVKQHIAKYTNTSKMVIIFNRICIPGIYEGKGPSTKLRPFKVLHMAQIGRGKNQQEGLEAVKKLLEEGLDVELEFAGDNTDPKYFNQLTHYIIKNSLQEKVFFSGFTKHPYEKIMKANIVILSSRCEACALTIFETLRIGTPIIVSNTGGNTEIINDGETGLIYELGNSEDLAKKIKLLYRDQELAQRLSDNAKQYSAKYYSTVISIDQIKSVIEN